MEAAVTILKDVAHPTDVESGNSGSKIVDPTRKTSNISSVSNVKQSIHVLQRNQKVTFAVLLILFSFQVKKSIWLQYKSTHLFVKLIQVYKFRLLLNI